LAKDILSRVGDKYFYSGHLQSEIAYIVGINCILMSGWMAKWRRSR